MSRASAPTRSRCASRCAASRSTALRARAHRCSPCGKSVLNASAASLFYRAPVLDALAIDGLTANLVRLDAQRFNFSDILERLQAKPKTDDAPPRFSLNNIQVTASTVHFGRPASRRQTRRQRHRARHSIPVQPCHRRRDRCSTRARSAARRHTDRDQGRDAPLCRNPRVVRQPEAPGPGLPKYLAYSPVRLNFAIPHGALTTDLRVAFRRAAPARGERPAVEAQNDRLGPLRSGGLCARRAGGPTQAADRVEVPRCCAR